jgi:hypothetical protein
MGMGLDLGVCVWNKEEILTPTSSRYAKSFKNFIFYSKISPWISIAKMSWSGPAHGFLHKKIVPWVGL